MYDQTHRFIIRYPVPSSQPVSLNNCSTCMAQQNVPTRYCCHACSVWVVDLKLGPVKDLACHWETARTVRVWTPTSGPCNIFRKLVPKYVNNSRRRLVHQHLNLTPDRNPNQNPNQGPPSISAKSLLIMASTSDGRIWQWDSPLPKFTDRCYITSPGENPIVAPSGKQLCVNVCPYPRP